MVSLIENALSLIPSDSHQAGHLLSFYGQVLGARTENYESAHRAFEQALNIAHRKADAALEMRTLTWAAAADCFHLRFAQSLERSTQALQLSHIVHDPYVAADARHWCAVVLTITGDLEQASVQARAGLELAENLHDRQRLAAVLWNHQAIAQLKGDWEAARESCERGLAAWLRDPRFLGNRASLEYQVGNAELGASYLGQLTEAARAAELEPNIEHAILATEIPFIGRIIGSLDNAEAAEQAGERVLSSSSATPLAALIARIGLGLLAVQREDSAAARRYYADLETTLRGITFVELSGQHLLGLLAQTMGSLDAAEGHFQEALDFCRRAGISPELGWSALDYARLLLQRGRPDDHARGAALLEVARDIASRFHLPPLEQQVALVQPQHRPLADTLSVYPDGLTHREVEVLGLISLGKTNREIAEDLFISLHTVIRHVSNILSKTGAANRAEAASYALRHKLLQ